MNLPNAFSRMALKIGQAVGAPFHDGLAKWPGVPVKDQGGSIIEAGETEEHSCKVQIDSTTELMRSDGNYRDGDVRMIILADGLARQLDGDAQIKVLSGVYADTEWMISSIERDPAGIGYICKGRKA